MKETSKKPLVLLVDDDLAFCRVVSNALVAKGYESIPTSSFEVAISMIRKEDRPFVLFVDYDYSKFGALLAYVQKSSADRVWIYVWTDSKLPSDILKDVLSRGGDGVLFKSPEAPMDAFSMRIDYAARKIKLTRLSGMDFKTGVYNWDKFWSDLDAELHNSRDRGYPGVVSLISIDVDHFKKINDDHGHDIGDEALKIIALVLETHVRPLDRVYRMGAASDEFLVLLPNADANQADLVGIHLQQEVSKALVPGKDGDPIPLSISYGVAQMERVEIDFIEESMKELLRRVETGPRGLITRRKLARV